MTRDEFVKRMSRRMDLPMAILGMLMLVAVLAEVFIPHDHPARPALETMGWVIWGLFAIEFIITLMLVRDRRAYLRHHWIDVLVVLLPMFRVVRALRFLAGVEAYPLLELVAFIGKGSKALHRFSKQSQLGYLFGVTVLVTLIGGIGIHLFERDATDGQLRTFGDSIWYSAALMTTVGSELDPVTGGGRLIALAMMIYAMVVVVYLIGSVSAFLLAKTKEQAEPTIPLGPTHEEVQQVKNWKQETPAG
jgi:voltage-gated potassium channel